MRTLNYLKKEKQIEKAKETIEIYAPLAHRLGMSHLKWELEDLSFRYLYHEMYYEIAHKVASNRKQREKDIQEAIDLIKTKMSKQFFKFDIYGRPKHLYSIYQKMKRKEIDFNEIYDLTAIRVIVETVRECYEVMGLVHELWKPIPGRFKDYIAMPKSNMYQSLHTTVIGPKGDPLEIQIRTFDMHKTAEYGIAAHWIYKEGKTRDKEFEEKLSWLRQILEWQSDLEEPHEFMENLKVDLFEDEVFVFTPKGDVISLPRGGTPVDFAYHIHTEIGDRCVGAKINGKIIPLEYRLKNGDIVEVLTSKNSTGPSQDWLKFVKTSKARSKIKHWFKQQHREEIIQRGKDILERELKKRNIVIKESSKNKELLRIAQKMGRNRVEDLLEVIGYNQIDPRHVVEKFSVVKKKEEIDVLNNFKVLPRKSSLNKGIKVKGMDDFMVRLSKCCNPVPGDEIVGYITRGRGVSVHRKDCPNFKDIMKNNKERLIDVSWDNERSDSYIVNLSIEAINKNNLLNDITGLIKDEKIYILSVNARADKYNKANIDLSLELSSLEHMRDIMKKLEDISGILSVYRAKST
jgi:GTP diphosphokinase / guanosine-3',5'-bis(diphosphate) 3'-diphosphatase